MSDLYLSWLQVNELSLSVEVLSQSSLPLFFSFHFHMLIPPAEGNLTSFASHGQPWTAI